MSGERRYSEQEVRAILDRALRQEQAGGLSHADLLEAAGEVGISRAALEEAAREVEATRERDLARERILARRRAGFISHLWAFIGVQIFLIAINMLSSPSYWWFLYPLLGWGLGLFLSARQGLSKEVSEGSLQREMARSQAAARRVASVLRDPSREMGRRLESPGARVSEASEGKAASGNDASATSDSERQRRRS
jgi:2TM domain-containing protein